MGSHVPGAVCPGCTLSDAAGRQALAAARERDEGDEFVTPCVLGEYQGINDGDYVVVKEQPVANNGDIVVAIIDDGATVKRFYKESDHIRLQPENSTMESNCLSISSSVRPSTDALR